MTEQTNTPVETNELSETPFSNYEKDLLKKGLVFFPQFAEAPTNSELEAEFEKRTKMLAASRVLDAVMFKGEHDLIVEQTLTSDDGVDDLDSVRARLTEIAEDHGVSASEVTEEHCWGYIFIMRMVELSDDLRIGQSCFFLGDPYPYVRVGNKKFMRLPVEDDPFTDERDADIFKIDKPLLVLPHTMVYADAVGAAFPFPYVSTAIELDNADHAWRNKK